MTIHDPKPPGAQPRVAEPAPAPARGGRGPGEPGATSGPGGQWRGPFGLDRVQIAVFTGLALFFTAIGVYIAVQRAGWEDPAPPRPTVSLAELQAQAYTTSEQNIRSLLATGLGQPPPPDVATQAAIKNNEEFRALLKKDGTTTVGKDRVVSIEGVDFRQLQGATMRVCIEANARLLENGKDVRTDSEGTPVKPGQRLAWLYQMRFAGGDTYLVDEVIGDGSC